MSNIGQEFWGRAIRQHESEVVGLIRQGRLFDAARADSPSAIGSAYAWALDALEPHIGSRPDFQTQAEDLISLINSWVRQVDRIYSDYLDTSRNISRNIDHEDILRAAEIAVSGITVADIIVELAQITFVGLASGDINKFARYGAAVQEFKEKIEYEIGINIIGRR